jgi:putative colanic acid biosynthesis acetyltransferase WcaB
MTLLQKIKLDLKANKNNSKGRWIVVSYRIANHIHYSSNILVKIFGFPFRKLYSWIFIWLIGIEIPEDTVIGVGLQVWHGSGLVVNHKTIIGDNVLLRHCITLGNKFLGSGVPKIGNNVEIGSQSVLIGDIEIGDNVTIGAGSIVTKSIPANCVAFGNPAKYKLKTT